MFNHLKKRRENLRKKVYPEHRARYDIRHEKELIPLSLIVTIVPRSQKEFFIDSYNEQGAPMNIILYAYSNPPKELLKFIGEGKEKKTVLLTVCRSEDVANYLAIAKNRFETNDQTRGISFSLPITNVAGIATYKYFSDIHRDERLLQILKENNNG